jgi:uncharacterized protein YjbI with pentapeptide repeats
VARRSGPPSAPDDRPIAPRLPPDLPVQDLADISDGDLSEVELTGVLPDDFDEPLHLRDVRLAGASLVGARIGGSRWIDVAVTSSDLSGADLEQAAFTRVAVRDSRLSGVQFASSRWHDVRVEECRLDAVSLAMSTSQRVRFERCLLAGVDLRGARFEGVAWWDCDLSDADCTGVNLLRAHLHGSRLDGLRGGSSLHPVSVDAEQFTALAEHLLAELGIEVTPRPVD